METDQSGERKLGNDRAVKLSKIGEAAFVNYRRFRNESDKLKGKKSEIYIIFK